MKIWILAVSKKKTIQTLYGFAWNIPISFRIFKLQIEQNGSENRLFWLTDNPSNLLWQESRL